MNDQFQQAELIKGQYYVSQTNSNEPTQQSFTTRLEQIVGGPFPDKKDAIRFVSQQTQPPTSFQVWQHTEEYASKA